METSLKFFMKTKYSSDKIKSIRRAWKILASLENELPTRVLQNPVHDMKEICYIINVILFSIKNFPTKKEKNGVNCNLFRKSIYTCEELLKIRLRLRVLTISDAQRYFPKFSNTERYVSRPRSE